MARRVSAASSWASVRWFTARLVTPGSMACRTAQVKGSTGWCWGGGAELALSDRVSARAEYRHIDYGGINFPDNTLDFTGHEVTAAVLFNF